MGKVKYELIPQKVKYLLIPQLPYSSHNALCDCYFFLYPKETSRVIIKPSRTRWKQLYKYWIRENSERSFQRRNEKTCCTDWKNLVANLGGWKQLSSTGFKKIRTEFFSGGMKKFPQIVHGRPTFSRQVHVRAITTLRNKTRSVTEKSTGTTVKPIRHCWSTHQW